MRSYAANERGFQSGTSGSRACFIVVAVLVALATLAVAAEDFDPPIDWLRRDARSAHVVAHVRVERPTLLQQIGDYYLYSVDAIVVEPFKGAYRRGWRIEFHVVTEGEIRDRFSGDRVVFLRWSDDTPGKQWKLGAIENSTFPYTEKVGRRLRTIRAGRSPR